MGNRLELHYILKDMGTPNVYYQPPESIKLKYPAIIYKRNNIVKNYADNETYKKDVAYSLTVIDKNPDSEIVENVSNLKKCDFDRHFVSDGLNHDVFTIYF